MSFSSHRASALQHPHPLESGDECQGRAGASRALRSSSVSFWPCLQQPSLPFLLFPSFPSLSAVPLPLPWPPFGFRRSQCQHWLEAAWRQSRTPAASLSPGSEGAFQVSEPRLQRGLAFRAALGTSGLWSTSLASWHGRLRSAFGVLDDVHLVRDIFECYHPLMALFQSLKICGLWWGQPGCCRRARV